MSRRHTIARLALCRILGTIPLEFLCNDLPQSASMHPPHQSTTEPFCSLVHRSGAAWQTWSRVGHRRHPARHMLCMTLCRTGATDEDGTNGRRALTRRAHRCRSRWRRRRWTQWTTTLWYPTKRAMLNSRRWDVVATAQAINNSGYGLCHLR